MKIEKGMVFYLRRYKREESYIKNNFPNIIRKGRKWVVVSSHDHKGTVTMVPLSSTIDDRPYHAVFKTEGSRKSKALCEQITTYDISVLHRKGNRYCYKVSGRALSKIDRALREFCGDSLDEVVRKVGPKVAYMIRKDIKEVGFEEALRLWGLTSREMSKVLSRFPRKGDRNGERY